MTATEESLSAEELRQTPMLRQYLGVKRQYPDALLFFRMGDFFELFFEDARIAARVLHLTLTSRSKDGEMPMAGVPVKSVDTYLKRCIQAGHTVVICDQIEDPRLAKGLVERAVTRVVTAGTILEDALLESTRNNFLVAVMLCDPGTAGICWIDLSTAHFEGTQIPVEILADELARLSPSEVLIPERLSENLPEPLQRYHGGEDSAVFTVRPDFEFGHQAALENLLQQFGMRDLSGFGIDSREPWLAAAGAVLAYVKDTQRGLTKHLCRLSRRHAGEFMLLDRTAQFALELLETQRERRREGSLLACIDRTVTSSGARLLRELVLSPLVQRAAIERRQAAVAEWFEDDKVRERVRDALKGVFDIERITARLALKRASPRDLAQLRDSLEKIPLLAQAIADVKCPWLGELKGRAVDPPGLVDLLARALVQEPPLAQKDGGFIRTGYSRDLDELRELRFHSKETIARLQQKEIERTGISSLKVGFNAVFGYYIEVTNVHKESVPADYIRKQTLKNAERYITPELKEHESKVLMAEERALALEQDLFEELRSAAASRVLALQELARTVAQLDVVASLAGVAREQEYVRPSIEDSTCFEVEEGRHPVLATTLGRESLVPNDCHLGGDHPPFVIITGPNMAGKSTYLRQNALILLLAQIGSFVPAKAARIGIADRIFTRVGASDDLVRGASTFMVEMTETANILHHATRNSFVVLDEIGRGTGTTDGVALARAITEHLARTLACRTLFATHYHQLIEMAASEPLIRNLCVDVREWGEDILFLHKIVEGGTDRSYGIHVARLAGIPKSVIERARVVFAEIERLQQIVAVPVATENQPLAATTLSQLPKTSPAPSPAMPSSIEKILHELRRLDLDRTTPLEALQKLFQLQRLVADLARKRSPRPHQGNDGRGLFDASEGCQDSLARTEES